MAMILIEGFETIDPTFVMSAANVRDLFQASSPDSTGGWFGGAGDSVQHESGTGRISGNCLKFSRGANPSPSWAADTGANLGFSFIPKQKMTLGWATKYSAVPTEPIPLACFRYDSGAGDQEQISVWATPDGKVYVSSTPYAAAYSALVYTINPLAVTPANAFRFTQWTYFEIALDYSLATPRVTILVNGTVVLDAVESVSLIQMPEFPYVSSAHILNPSIQHFDDIAVTQLVDDLYLDDSVTHGPQWIAPLTNDAVLLDEGWGAAPDDVYPTIAAISGTNWGDQLSWSLIGMPAGVGVVNAIGVNMIAEQAVTVDAIDFGVTNNTTTNVRSKRGSVVAGDPPKCLRYVTQSPPGPLLMTGASLVGLHGYLRASQVVI
jgi:hypothetical protein